MTYSPHSGYCPLLMEAWQYKAAFVLRRRPETGVAAGRFEGRVEHIASCEAVRFHSFEALLGFTVRVLAEARHTEER